MFTDRGMYTSLCRYGGATPPPPLNSPGLGLYPSIPEPLRLVVVVHVPRTLSSIKYDCYGNLPHSVPMGRAD